MKPGKRPWWGDDLSTKVWPSLLNTWASLHMTKSSCDGSSSSLSCPTDHISSDDSAYHRHIRRLPMWTDRPVMLSCRTVELLMDGWQKLATITYT